MEDNVLCYSEERDQYQAVRKKIITPEWMAFTGFKPVPVPEQKPLLCDEVKAKNDTPVNKGGRPKKEKLIN